MKTKCQHGVFDCPRLASITCGRCRKDLCTTHAHHGTMNQPCPDESTWIVQPHTRRMKDGKTVKISGHKKKAVSK